MKWSGDPVRDAIAKGLVTTMRAYDADLVEINPLAIVREPGPDGTPVERLVCLDANTGKEHWRIDFMNQFKSPLPAFGFVCSPLVDCWTPDVACGTQAPIDPRREFR